MNDSMKSISELVAKTLVTAGSTFRPDKKAAYREAIARESNESSRWMMSMILENAETAEKQRSPLCDDTGIPHLLLEIGPSHAISGELLAAIQEGVAEGLRRLPGRPMAVKGDGEDRLGQVHGMHDDPSRLEPAPLALRKTAEDVLRLHILMFGGGPAIRGRSYRVFHQHSAQKIEDQIIEWSKEACAQLGCTPCTLAVGIGRSHYEAAHLMLESQTFGSYKDQSDFERRITNAVNQSGIGSLGIGGDTTVLATFVRIGPQRSSGVRIVCLRPCCCFEPRVASVELPEELRER